jgi:hypothetical protein
MFASSCLLVRWQRLIGRRKGVRKGEEMIFPVPESWKRRKIKRDCSDKKQHGEI